MDLARTVRAAGSPGLRDGATSPSGGSPDAAGTAGDGLRSAAVSVVINTFDDARFLADAIDSVRAQSVAACEIIVVDDGSTLDPSPIVSRYAGVRLIRQANAGLASARNAGLAAASGTFIVFLDADDRLLADAIAAGLDCFARSPQAAWVFGAYRDIDADGRPIGHDRTRTLDDARYERLLGGNHIAMHATVLYRRDALQGIGGFDARLRLCEDYDAFLRLGATQPFACHRTLVAEYRHHGANISGASRRMLAAALAVHRRHRPPPDGPLDGLWREGRRFWIRYYANELRSAIGRELRGARRPARLAPLSKDLLIVATRYVLMERSRALARRVGRRLLPASMAWPPRVGRVRLGHLASVRPVSMDFGFDRGLPIDRRYIEAFLERRREDIRGVALEIGDASYCQRYGGARVSTQHVLHVHAGNPVATLVGDFADPAVVRDEVFDCMVLTQTLHLIYDVRAAVARMHAALKPGGTVLLTVPGITQIDRGEWKDVWYWSFTAASMQRLFGEVFGAEHVTVEAFGNVHAATAYLHGLCVDEVDADKLDIVDAAYPVTITVRATRP